METFDVDDGLQSVRVKRFLWVGGGRQGRHSSFKVKDLSFRNFINLFVDNFFGKEGYDALQQKF